MHRHRLVRVLVSTCLVTTVVVAGSVLQPHPSARAATSTTTRPIADFVNAQGTYCISDDNGGCAIFLPPVANFPFFTDPFTNRVAAIDYAGLAKRVMPSIGTTTSGTVTERPLADGRAEVDVQLH